MSHVVDYVTVSTAGLESSPHAAALAGLRANESRSRCLPQCDGSTLAQVACRWRLSERKVAPRQREHR